MALVAVLIWGSISYTKLGQQEDPSIPQRIGLLVTQFPGATASKVEELVTKVVERNISEMDSVEEISSQSRPGLSTLQIKLRPGSYSYIDLQWEKLRTKAREVVLPEGCHQPFLASDFGTTITLLFGITSPPASDAECIARANLIHIGFSCETDPSSGKSVPPLRTAPAKSLNASVNSGERRNSIAPPK